MIPFAAKEATIHIISIVIRALAIPRTRALFVAERDTGRHPENTQSPHMHHNNPLVMVSGISIYNLIADKMHMNINISAKENKEPFIIPFMTTSKIYFSKLYDFACSL